MHLSVLTLTFFSVLCSELTRETTPTLGLVSNRPKVYQRLRKLSTLTWQKFLILSIGFLMVGLGCYLGLNLFLFDFFIPGYGITISPRVRQ